MVTLFCPYQLQIEDVALHCVAWERNKNSADTSAFWRVISCLSRNVLYYHISQKKKKKLKSIATQGLETEAGSEEKPSNCCTAPHCVCQCLPSTSPSALPSCWRTASVSAQPLTMHTAQGLREDLLWPQHIFPHSLSNLGPAQTSLECTTFCRAFPSSFPCYCKRKQQQHQFSHQIPFIPATAFRISLDFGSMGFWAWFPQC